MLILFFTVMLCSAAEKVSFWINTQECPLEINEDRDFISVSNKNSHRVSEFQLGCIRLGDKAQWKIGKAVGSVKGPIDALDGVYITSSDDMLDFHYKCGARYWSLGIVKILFDDGSIWDLKEHKALVRTKTGEKIAAVQTQDNQQPSDHRVEHADIPFYPNLARTARISGVVQVEITVIEGKVASTKVKSGPPILASATVENILTWRFFPLVNGIITTKFIYQLETTELLDPQNPRVELQLPFFVKITAVPVYLDQKKQNSN